MQCPALRELGRFRRGWTSEFWERSRYNLPGHCRQLVRAAWTPRERMMTCAVWQGNAAEPEWPPQAEQLAQNLSKPAGCFLQHRLPLSPVPRKCVSISASLATAGMGIQREGAPPHFKPAQARSVVLKLFQTQLCRGPDPFLYPSVGCSLSSTMQVLHASAPRLHLPRH